MAGDRPTDGVTPATGSKYTSCDHEELRVVVRNMPLVWCPGKVNRQEEVTRLRAKLEQLETSTDEAVEVGGCDGVFFIFGGYLMPKEWLPRMSVFQLEWFGKHYGLEALRAAVEKPIPRLDRPAEAPAIAGLRELLQTQSQKELHAPETRVDQGTDQP